VLITRHIYAAFSNLPVSLTNKEIAGMETLVIQFEVRDPHPLTLSGQVFGVDPIVFSPQDKDKFFDLFGIDEKDLKAIIAKIPSVTVEHRVRSEPFAMLSLWLVHLATVLIKNERVRHAFQMNVLKYLHYRWFTSSVNHTFSRGASREIMAITIDSLTRKYDIITYGTWKRTIEARCEDFLSKGSRFYEVVESVDDDELFLRAIADMQNRVRDKIKNIVSVYFQVHASPQRVVSKSAVSEIDGEKVLTQTISTFDVMKSAMATELLEVSSFVDPDVAGYIATLFPAASKYLLVNSLRAMSTLAVSQGYGNKLDLVTTGSEQKIYVGMRVLVDAILQTSYRYCIRRGIPLTNRKVVLLRVKDAFASSRISDPEITAIKESLVQFVDKYGKTSRDATKSSLRLAIVSYIIARSFRYL
jgi:hypothetical protein